MTVVKRGDSMTIDEILAKPNKEVAHIEKEQEERYQMWLKEERF